MSKLTKEELKERFSVCAFEVDTLGCVVEEAEPGRSVVSLKIDERHMNGRGKVMGGVIYSLADFAFAVCANLEEFATVTTQSSVTFYDPPKGSELIARAECVKEGKKLRFCDIEVTDDAGTKVASVRTMGYYTGDPSK